MKRTALIFGLCVALGAVSATPAAAQERKKEKDSGNSELVGRLLGAGVGALLGSQVGGGKGKLAAVAVGALAGAWIGGELANRLTQSDQQGIARTTNTALDTGESQTWTNPDTGVKTNVQAKERTVERVPAASEGLKSRPWETPPLEYVNAHYQVVRGSNVRSGPGLNYPIYFVASPGTALFSGSELSPRKAAEACVVTAEKLEAAGHRREAIGLYERARQHDAKAIDYSRRLSSNSPKLDHSVQVCLPTYPQRSPRAI